MIGLTGGRGGRIFDYIISIYGRPILENPVRRNIIKISCIYHIQIEIFITNDAGEKKIQLKK